jgi:hypothetical protein
MPDDPTAPPFSGPTPVVGADWPLRAIALVPLVALALLWSNHHLGVGAGHPEAMGLVAAALPVALGVVGKLLDKAEQDSLSAKLRNLVALNVTWFVVLILYLSMGAIALTWSSVLVVPDEGKGVGRVTLRAVESASAQVRTVEGRERGEPARFVVASRPFGRSFSLHVDGFVPQVVDVYPIFGVRVRPNRDLRRTPSVLLRLSALAVGAWKDSGGAELRVLAVDANGAEQLITSTNEPAWAILLGRGQAIPTTLSADWRSELVVKGVTEPEQERHMREWRRPRQLPLQQTLDMDKKLRVQLVNARKVVVAQVEFFIGREELQDQAVEDLI